MEVQFLSGKVVEIITPAKIFSVFFRGRGLFQLGKLRKK